MTTKIKFSFIASFVLSAFGEIYSQNTTAYEFIYNPFRQPNDSTYNWYGSGDVNNDNLIDHEDINNLQELIDGIYSRTKDKRLYDRSDVTGDKVVDWLDKSYLEDFVLGRMTYLPGHWNKLITRQEKEEWLTKMLYIDRADTTCFRGGHYIQGCDCSQYQAQTMINFHGFDAKDLNEFLKIYPYDTTNNGRFNLPVLELSFFPYINGQGETGHAMNTIMLGDSLSKWNDYSHIEPQFDAICVQLGEYYLNVGDLQNGIYIDSIYIWIQGPPIDHYYPWISEQPIFSSGITFMVPDNRVPRLDGLYDHGEMYPNFKLITTRDKNSPIINITSPKCGGIYNAVKLEASVIDETIFNQIRWVNDMPTHYGYDSVVGNIAYGGGWIYGEKIFYNKYNRYSIDDGITYQNWFVKANFNLKLTDGDYLIELISVDDFGNSSIAYRSFSIDKTPPIANIMSPINGYIYDNDSIKFIYNLADIHLDIVKSNYSNNDLLIGFKQNSDSLSLESSEGQNTLSIVVVDSAGNCLNQTIEYTVDTEPVRIIASIIEGYLDYILQDSNLDLLNCYYELNKDGNRLYFSESKGILPLDLIAGNNIIEIYAFDLVGHKTILTCEYMHTPTEMMFINNNQVLIYPNPVNKYIYIKSIPNGLVNIRVTNNQGVEIMQIKENVSDGIVRIDFPDYPKGLYIMKITDCKNELHLLKFVKE